MGLFDKFSGKKKQDKNVTVKNDVKTSGNSSILKDGCEYYNSGRCNANDLKRCEFNNDPDSCTIFMYLQLRR